MPTRPELKPVPASRDPLARLTVERAVSELRRGRPVAIRAGRGRAGIVLAAEAASADGMAELESMAQASPRLAITGRRAAVLALFEPRPSVVIVSVAGGGLDPDRVRDLADPLSGVSVPPPFEVEVAEADRFGCESAGVMLAKTARLLPAAVCASIHDPAAEDLDAWAGRHDLLLVDAGDVFQYDGATARALQPVSEARVPLDDAEDTRIIAFRPRDGGLEHLALVLGRPDTTKPVLTRLHSECFTGDLLGSLRCDCGDQLRGAIRAIAEAGGGVLLYLAQEGRGIGLVNKLRAYELQDRGFDTIDANEQLGFDADERVYRPAAQMLRRLEIAQVRLLTNNPAKVAGLARCGIAVTERVPHAFPGNRHNEAYLRTKAVRGGHLF